MDDGTVARPFVPEHQAGNIMPDAASVAAMGNDENTSSLTTPSRFATWIRLVRPSALLLVLLPALTALALLWIRGATILVLPALAGVIGLTFIQAGASLLDVFLEYARRLDVAHSRRRDQLTAHALLAHARIRQVTVLTVSIVLMLLGVVASIPLIAVGGGPVMAVGVAAVGIAFLSLVMSFILRRYSLANLFIGLALGPGVVSVMILAQHQMPTSGDLLIAGSLGLLAMLPTEAAHLRDADQDRREGRRTLVTVMGDTVGRAVYVFIVLAAMALLAVAAVPQGAPHGALLGFFALPAFSIPISGVLRASPGDARAQIVAQELRAYAIFAFWLLVGLALNAILIYGLGPIPPAV
ncbi:MAG TPA: prenyltransferase [Ktedonobacterales bacterium]|nr:prenyltransferase [Ktedonobacterales bacterium]